MLTLQIKFSVEDIIDSLDKLDKVERLKLQKALCELQADAALQESVNRGLADVENGRVIPHSQVMAELRKQNNL